MLCAKDADGRAAAVERAGEQGAMPSRCSSRPCGELRRGSGCEAAPSRDRVRAGAAYRNVVTTVFGPGVMSVIDLSPGIARRGRAAPLPPQSAGSHGAHGPLAPAACADSAPVRLAAPYGPPI